MADTMGLRTKFKKSIKKVINGVKKTHPEGRITPNPKTLGFFDDVYVICSKCRNQKKVTTKPRLALLLFTIFSVVSMILMYILKNDSRYFLLLIGLAPMNYWKIRLQNREPVFNKLSYDKKLDYAKEYLAQCSQCNDWVCISDCWDGENRKCKSCA